MRFMILLSAFGAMGLVIWLLRKRMRQHPVKVARRMMGRLVLVTGLAFVGLYFGLAWSVARIFTHPIQRPVGRTPLDVGIDAYEDVWLTSSDGVELAGWYIPSENRAAVILLHGTATNRTVMLLHAKMLAAAGYGLVMIDMRGHGNSGAAISTLGYDEVKDVRAAVDYLLTRPDVDADRIGILGRSMGGATAIRATAQIPEIGALVAESTFSSIEDVANTNLRQITGLPPGLFMSPIAWFAERDTGVSIEQLRPVDEIATISPRPVLLLHGEQDRFVPVRESELLYAAAQAPKDFQRFGTSGHIGLIIDEEDRYRQIVVGFFDQWLLESNEEVVLN